MALDTLDAVVAGFQPPQQLLKVGTTMEAAGVWHTFWYTGGRPAAATANAAGVNGRACSASTPGTGHIPRSNPTGGDVARLARLGIAASQPGTFMLIDRLWENSGLSVTSTSPQGITAAALPARDNNASTNGEGVFAAVEWSSTGGAGTPTVTLTYTDQDNNPSATAAFTGTATPQAGTFEIFPLAAGDSGIRAPSSFVQSATRTSGTMHLVLFRIIALVEITAANIGNAIDPLTSGMPRIFDDACLQLLWLPNTTTAVNLQGQYIETQG